MSQRVVRYRAPDGIRTAIVEEAGKHIRVCVIDAPMTVRRVPASEGQYMTDIDYPLERAKKRYRRAGRRLGMGKNARRFLRGAQR